MYTWRRQRMGSLTGCRKCKNLAIETNNSLLYLLYLLCIIVFVDTGNQPDADVCEGTLHSRPRGEKDGAVLNKCKFIVFRVHPPAMTSSLKSTTAAVVIHRTTQCYGTL